MNALPNILHDTGHDPFFFPVLSNDEPKITRTDSIFSHLDEANCKTIID